MDYNDKVLNAPPSMCRQDTQKFSRLSHVEHDTQLLSTELAVQTAYNTQHKAWTADTQESYKKGLTEMDSHLLELGPCCTIKAPSKLEQCSVRMAEGLLIASEAHMALHSLTRLSI